MDEQADGDRGPSTGRFRAGVVSLPTPWVPRPATPPTGGAPSYGCGDCRASPVVLAVVAFLLWGVAFILPFWVTTARYSEGLWGFCLHFPAPQNATGLFQCAWMVPHAKLHSVAQGVFASGIIWAIIGIAGGIGAFCCGHPVGCRRFVGLVHVLASLLVMASVAVYSYQRFSHSDITVIKALRMLSVCFYAALAGCVMNVIAGGLFFTRLVHEVVPRKKYNTTPVEPARNVNDNANTLTLDNDNHI